MDEPIRVEVDGAPRRRRGGGRGWLMLPGLLFLALGVLVIVVPEIITAMVASVFFLIGFGLLIAASKVRRAQARFTAFEQQVRGRW